MNNTSIVAAGHEVDLGCRVIRWNEPGGFSFYPYKTFNAHGLTYEQLQDKLSCFVLHHSVTYRAQQTYHGLVSRGLSVNFIIDDDEVDGYATIYQCLDIQEGGWSHVPLNDHGPGVEISFMPIADPGTDHYSTDNQQKYQVPEHQRSTDVIHGQILQIYQPTEAQVKSVTALLSGYCNLFEKIPAQFPRDDSGNLLKTVCPEVANYRGLLNHYHVTRNKIDCVGLDLERIEQEIQESSSSSSSG